MRCPGCEYTLWNLTARVCPECGRPFAPSQFDFIANSVRFCCPHCQQDYYGTGPRGHLEPRAFTCLRCHNAIDMDQMVLLPTEGVTEAQTQVDQVPWLERARIGRFKALFTTVGRAMFEPRRLARATPDGSSAWEAWRFSILANLGLLVFGFGGIFLLPLAFVGGRAGMAWSMAAAFSVMSLIILAIILLLFPLWGLCSHLVLRMTGPTRLGGAASVRTVCYASGVNVCAAVPCLGIHISVLSVLWTGFSAAAMFRIVHGVGWFRGLLAGLLPPLLVYGVIITLIVALAGMPVASTRISRVQASAQQSSAAHLQSALAAYRARHNDRFPPHAIALMQEGDLVGSDLMMLTFGAPPSQPEPILSSFQAMTTDQQAALTDRLTASLPKDTVAHRLGDVVFTYHGIDPASGDPRLWVALFAPARAAAADPGADAGELSLGGDESPDTITAVTLGGATQRIPRSAFAAALARQNALRAPLPPLPDPAAVAPGQPATAP